MPVKVAIVEDQKEIREMLSVLIGGSSGFALSGAYESAEAAIESIPTQQPDVVLVDIHLPSQNGISCVNTLRSLCSNTQFIMCTSLEDSDSIFNALKAGAHGYLTKSTPPAKLLEAIIEVKNGGSPMSAQIARKVVSAFQNNNQSASAEFESLSKREQEILLLLSKGFRYKEIAERIFVSVETVRTHVRNIYEKLQVNSRTEALNKAFGK
jgi:DNA-binding NarL/FixJ family response regulator